MIREVSTHVEDASKQELVNLLELTPHYILTESDKLTVEGKRFSTSLFEHIQAKEDYDCDKFLDQLRILEQEIKDGQMPDPNKLKIIRSLRGKAVYNRELELVLAKLPSEQTLHGADRSVSAVFAKAKEYRNAPDNTQLIEASVEETTRIEQAITVATERLDAQSKQIAVEDNAPQGFLDRLEQGVKKVIAWWNVPANKNKALAAVGGVVLAATVLGVVAPLLHQYFDQHATQLPPELDDRLKDLEADQMQAPPTYEASTVLDPTHVYVMTPDQDVPTYAAPPVFESNHVYTIEPDISSLDSQNLDGDKPVYYTEIPSVDDAQTYIPDQDGDDKAFFVAETSPAPTEYFCGRDTENTSYIHFSPQNNIRYMTEGIGENFVKPIEIILHWDENTNPNKDRWVTSTTYNGLAGNHTSSTFAVGVDGVLQMAKMTSDTVQSTYASTGHYEAINIEMAGYDFDNNPPPESELNYALDLVIGLMQQYNLSIDAVVGHYDHDQYVKVRGNFVPYDPAVHSVDQLIHTGKPDPGPEFLNNFKQQLVQRLLQIGRVDLVGENFAAGTTDSDDTLGAR